MTKLIHVIVDHHEAGWVNPEHVSAIVDRDGMPGICDVYLLGGQKIAVSNTADGVIKDIEKGDDVYAALRN